MPPLNILTPLGKQDISKMRITELFYKCKWLIYENELIEADSLLNTDLARIENRKFIIEEQWLDTPLTKEMKKELCNIIDLRNKDKRKTGWTTLKKGLNESGYSVKDIRKTIDGIKKSFSIITKVN